MFDTPITRRASLGALLAGGLLFGGFAPSSALAADDGEEPAGIVEVKLIANTDTYTLNPKQQGEAFRNNIDPNGRDLPPKVDLTLEITNQSRGPITIFQGADSGGIDLKLEGPGAVSIRPRVIQTREFRMGKPVVVGPGETMKLPITALHGGQRNVGQFWYWTEPGEYTLTATARLAYTPGEHRGDGFAEPQVTKAVAEPITLTVKAEE